MITLIILISVIIVGIYLTKKLDYEHHITVGFIILFFSMALIFHCFYFFMTPYNYEIFLTKRNAFEQTLLESRESGNFYETAAIVKEVAIWNEELAMQKYINSFLLLDQYVDDRIESLEPIK